jgi:3-deoxy-manno-octulosonate cytidylyltransferase (CMP-KDO synthetase)
MHVTAIIPARFASTRLPGKPLLDILGKPMIQRVYERTALAACVQRVIVATDDERIARAVRDFGGEVCLTRPDHATGTDRLAEVAQGLDCPIVINVQGDEPLIDPRMIDAAVTPMLEDPTIAMATLKAPLETWAEFEDVNVVKVVTDREGFALYFSRAPIPWPRDRQHLAAGVTPSDLGMFRHVGLYVYRRDFLLSFAKLPATVLEQLEQLEQLRALEYGHRIRVVPTGLRSLGVDTAADLERVRALLAAAAE